ncbi:MAG: MarR family transcriptional regulator [Bacillota bacterium]|jgi:DNA-binding MarR family transcriptional regulator|nr:MarR family transcriptional regulator [Bacillota bacterium]NLJ03998.1 MarR family transcriptional regulator [Bacillota bacterium]
MNEALRLENQLCFPLYAAAKAVTNSYKPFLESINLTYTQYIVMLVLWEKQNITVKDLGACLYLDSGTLTPLLKRLEAKGYIHRQRSPEDERVVEIVLSSSGEGLRDKAREIPKQMAQCLPLTDDEASTLYRLLYKILEQTC